MKQSQAVQLIVNITKSKRKIAQVGQPDPIMLRQKKSLVSKDKLIVLTGKLDNKEVLYLKKLGINKVVKNWLKYY